MHNLLHLLCHTFRVWCIQAIQELRKKRMDFIIGCLIMLKWEGKFGILKLSNNTQSWYNYKKWLKSLISVTQTTTETMWSSKLCPNLSLFHIRTFYNGMIKAEAFPVSWLQHSYQYMWSFTCQLFPRLHSIDPFHWCFLLQDYQSCLHTFSQCYPYSFLYI